MYAKISLALLLLIPATALGQASPLWAVAGGQRCPIDRLSYLASDCVVVRVQPGVLTMATVELRLDLPGHAVVIASRRRSEQSTATSLVWTGSIAGKSFSRATFSLVEHTV